MIQRNKNTRPPTHLPTCPPVLPTFLPPITWSSSASTFIASALGCDVLLGHPIVARAQLCRGSCCISMAADDEAISALVGMACSSSARTC